LLIHRSFVALTSSCLSRRSCVPPSVHPSLVLPPCFYLFLHPHTAAGGRTSAIQRRWSRCDSVRCNGKWVTVGCRRCSERDGLEYRRITGEDAEQLQAWLEPILDAVDADVVVSDDADAFKKVCDQTGRSQQVCKSHVGQNTDLWWLNSRLYSHRPGSFFGCDWYHFSTGIGGFASLKEMIHSRCPGRSATP